MEPVREFLRAVVHALEGGTPVELVSVITSSGSTPRGAGAMMAVFPDGAIQGTIGGGNVEYAAQKLAGELLAAGGDARREFRFIPGDAADLGMVCGGDVTLQFHFFSPQDQQGIAVLRDLIQASAGNETTWLIWRLEGERIAAIATADRHGIRHLAGGPPDLSALLKQKAVFQDSWFAVPVVLAGRTYIFGGGHVSRALVPVLASVGFRPVVYDDRPEFADSTLFPQAEAVLCGPFTDIGAHVTVTEEDDVVVMTRGHQADYEVLTQVLRSGARYLGCIGSSRKLALCRDRLLHSGFTEEEYARLHAPIGLDIGAETPEEIAVSVAAEMIAVRAGKMN